MIKLQRSPTDVLSVGTLAEQEDDHAKNFAFLLDDHTGEWSLSPAYDLTCSAGPGGEHTTTVLGEGRRPTREHCLRLADQAGIKSSEARATIDQVNTALNQWPAFAGQAGCARNITRNIATLIKPL